MTEVLVKGLIQTDLPYSNKRRNYIGRTFECGGNVYADSAGPDQPAHPRSLMPSLSKNKIIGYY